MLMRMQVITSWCYKDLHEREKNCMMVHDLVGHQLTASVRQTKYLLNVIQSIIAAEMTAVLQVTDVAATKVFKDYMHEAKHLMRQLLARKADEEKVKAVYKCGCYEMM